MSNEEIPLTLPRQGHSVANMEHPIWKAGEKAAAEGKTVDDNPYGEDQMIEQVVWMLGWFGVESM